MAQTPDHRQTAYRDLEVNIGSTGAGTMVSGPGGVRYNGSAFQLLDAQGQYDPRLVYQLTHSQLNDLIHVMAGGGPILSGAYKVTTYVAKVFVESETWYTSSPQATPISRRTFIYPSGSSINPTQEVWQVFDAAGNVAHTVTDVLTFSGITEVARQRSYL